MTFAPAIGFPTGSRTVTVMDSGHFATKAFGVAPVGTSAFVFFAGGAATATAAGEPSAFESSVTGFALESDCVLEETVACLKFPSLSSTRETAFVMPGMKSTAASKSPVPPAIEILALRGWRSSMIRRKRLFSE